MKNNKKVIDKICKCLRLSESSNPNEAALALRQAMSLMKKYGISDGQVISADIAESVTHVGDRYTPPFWALALANLVAEAFSCRNLISRCYGRRPEIRFIGLGFKAEIATYSYTVLHRHLMSAIEEFELLVKMPDAKGSEEGIKRQQRIDVFAQAWLFRIGNLVSKFLGDETDKVIVDKYIKDKYGETVEIVAQSSDADNGNYDDILHGMRAANNVELYRSVKHFMKPAFLQHKQAS